MTTALITGLTGQDGSYMAELLLSKNYQVIGLVRSISNAKKTILPTLIDKVELLEWDMLNQPVINNILKTYQPAEIYNFAAYSSGAGMFESPVDMAEVNGLAVVRILEAIREINSQIRLCQASSREIFGEALSSPQNELTLVNPRNPYGASKFYADSMVKIYRQKYNIFACSAILYNHESPRRGLEFVTRKITHEASRIKLGLSGELHLGDLNALRDWGFAGDTVNAMWLMLQHSYADDYIVATGHTHSVREFCECSFEYLGLDYRQYVREDVSAYRPVENAVLTGDASKAKIVLGWMPKVGFNEMVHMMVDADMRKLKQSFGKQEKINNV